jgi:ribonuclease BN (tRNA processing enzyme)
MVPTEVGRLCAAARPRRVALTHQYPDAAALDLAPLVNAIWDGPVDQAVDGSVYRVPEEDGR